MKGALADASAVAIATGGVIPAGTFGIIRWEIAKVNEGILNGQVVENQDIRPAAHECKSGDLLVKAGALLNPGKIGLLSAAGLDQIRVVRKPRVALILLGDEIQLKGIPAIFPMRLHMWSKPLKMPVLLPISLLQLAVLLKVHVIFFMRLFLRLMPRYLSIPLPCVQDIQCSLHELIPVQFLAYPATHSLQLLLWSHSEHQLSHRC
jgi:hypothetical protein